MHGRGFVGAEWTAEAVKRPLNYRLVIDRHGDGLTHFQVAGQHRIVKVEEQPLEAVLGRRIDERIVLEVLQRLKKLSCEKASRIDGARLQLLDKEVRPVFDAKDGPVQVG